MGLLRRAYVTLCTHNYHGDQYCRHHSQTPSWGDKHSQNRIGKCLKLYHEQHQRHRYLWMFRPICSAPSHYIPILHACICKYIKPCIYVCTLKSLLPVGYVHVIVVQASIITLGPKLTREKLEVWLIYRYNWSVHENNNLPEAIWQPVK